jgi:hypothetical protein
MAQSYLSDSLVGEYSTVIYLCEILGPIQRLYSGMRILFQVSLKMNNISVIYHHRPHILVRESPAPVADGCGTGCRFGNDI